MYLWISQPITTPPGCGSGGGGGGGGGGPSTALSRFASRLSVFPACPWPMKDLERGNWRLCKIEMEWTQDCRHDIEEVGLPYSIM